MIKQLRFLLASHLASKSKCPSLSELDAIYKKAISQLSVDAKEEYCQRLIRRAKYEIGEAKCNNEIQKLKQLMRSAKKELRKCGSKHIL